MRILLFIIALNLIPTVLMSQSSEKITFGASIIELKHFQGTELPNVLFLNVHEDEQTTVSVLGQLSGCHAGISGYAK